MSNLPFMLPTLVVGIIVAGLACRPLGRVLQMHWWAAFVLVAGTVLVLAVTLTPQRVTDGAVDVFAAVPAAEPPAGPGLWRWPWQWWPIDDRTLNIALFVPLGIGIGLVGRRGTRRALVVLALLSALAVEGTQHVVAWLARDSQWKDIVDNMTGVAIGLVVGLLIRRASRNSTAPAQET